MHVRKITPRSSKILSPLASRHRSGPALPAILAAFKAFAGERLFAAPGSFVEINKIAHAFATWRRQTDGAGLSDRLSPTDVRLTGRLCRASGFSPAVRQLFFGQRAVTCLIGYQLTGTPTPIDFLRHEMTEEPGAQTPWRAVVARFNEWRRADNAIGPEHAAALFVAAAPKLEIRAARRGTLSLLGWRFTDQVALPNFVKDRLCEDPGNLLPLARIVDAYNAWALPAPPVGAFSVSLVLRAAGLGDAVRQVVCSGVLVTALMGWRLAEDPAVAGFLADLIEEPGTATPLQSVAAAFSAWTPTGLQWDVQRVGQLLRARGFKIEVRRWVGRTQTVVVGRRLAGDLHTPQVFTQPAGAPKRDRARIPRVPRLSAMAQDSVPSPMMPLRGRLKGDEALAMASSLNLECLEIEKLAAAGIKTVDDLAGLDGEELAEASGMALARAGRLIMVARAHWFDALP